MKKIHFFVLKLCVLLITTPFFTKAQATDSSAIVMSKLIALRDDFIGKIKALGYTPSLRPPVIVMDNPRSYGNFDEETDTLHTSYWSTLEPKQQGLFAMAASRAGNGMSGEQYFELSVHQWIFIHEMGHWWRACQHINAEPYASEMGANRIDIAYWRERDPDFLKAKIKGFEGNLKMIPSPVPVGISKEKYLNENYDKLPGGPAYIWYQATMIVDGYSETPVLNFKKAIANGGETDK